MTLKSRWLLLTLIGGMIFSSGTDRGIFGQDYNVTNDWKQVVTGEIHQVILNRGRMDTGDSPSLIICEYPPGSGEEHIGDVGIWIGGITPEGDTLVTTGAAHRSADEFWPGTAPWDTIWTVERGEGPVDIGGTTANGEDDIYWENYTPTSDADYVTRYSDYQVLDPQEPTSGGYNWEPHTPLYLDVIQTVYSWGSPPLDETLIWTYYIIPTKHEIEEMYFTLQFDAAIGRISKNIESDDRMLYYPEKHLIVAEDDPDGLDGQSHGAIGFMFFLPDRKPQDALRWTYRWGHSNINRGFDAETYRFAMASGEVMANPGSFYGGEAWLSFGPYDLEQGDTLEIRMAEILGRGLDGVFQNAELIRRNAREGFALPSAPPSPPLTVQNLNKAVRLNWSPADGNNPETYEDPGRADSASVPFEGYRLYKSSQSKTGPWTLLAEYDIPDNAFGENIGLEYEYRDTGLLNNIEYYYTVTAYSKPDTVLGFPSQESSKFQGVQVARPGPVTPETVGEVAVVPNPYRGDLDYTEYIPPWEKSPSGRPWMEQDRRIQFVNLPADCEIRVYSAAGDFIKSIIHHNPEVGYENWNLTSYVNQAIASGVYIYTVEDLQSGKMQTGKFVVIK